MPFMFIISSHGPPPDNFCPEDELVEPPESYYIQACRNADEVPDCQRLCIYTCNADDK